MSQVKIEDAAFPSNEYGNLGMSLRDYFAGQALASITTEGIRTELMHIVAKRAYVIADAMLAERQKERK